MRVYIVHEYGGEYSDKWDQIIGVFSTKEPAKWLCEKKEAKMNEYREKEKIASRLLDEEITEKEAGMTKEEAEDWYYGSEHDEGYYIGSIEMDTEDIEKWEWRI